MKDWCEKVEIIENFLQKFGIKKVKISIFLNLRCQFSKFLPYVDTKVVDFAKIRQIRKISSSLVAFLLKYDENSENIEEKNVKIRIWRFCH